MNGQPGGRQGLVQRAHAARQRGVSLVELLISITLGAVAVAAAGTIYVANVRSFNLVEATARVQENARFAVELMGRDLREAGGIVCGGNLVQDNLILGTYPSSSNWWSDWSMGLKGYASPTDWQNDAAFTASIGSQNSAGYPTTGAAVVVWSASTAVPSLITAVSGETFNVSPNSSLDLNDVATACDDVHVSTFTLSTAAGATVQANKIPTTIRPGGYVNQLQASVWYVGDNGNGGSSLYRLNLNGALSGAQKYEILENVTGLAITYLVGDGNGVPRSTATDYVTADKVAITDWANVLAVRVVLTFASPDKVATASSGAAGATTVITQDFPFTVAIRRRLP